MYYPTLFFKNHWLYFRNPQTIPCLQLYSYLNIVTHALTISEFYCLMGYINYKDLVQIIWDGFIRGINININSKLEFYEVCVRVKTAHKSFPKKSNKDMFVFYSNKVTGDIWRLTTVKLLDYNYYYFLL